MPHYILVYYNFLQEIFAESELKTAIAEIFFSFLKIFEH